MTCPLSFLPPEGPKQSWEASSTTYHWPGMPLLPLPPTWGLGSGGLCCREGLLALLSTLLFGTTSHHRGGSGGGRRGIDEAHFPGFSLGTLTAAVLVLNISFANNSAFNYVTLKIHGLEIDGIIMNATENTLRIRPGWHPPHGDLCTNVYGLI